MKKLMLISYLFLSCMQTSCSTDEQTSTCYGFFTTVRNYIFRQSHIIEEHQTSHLNNKPQEKKQITYLPTQEIPTLFDLAFKVLEPDIRNAAITKTDFDSLTIVKNTAPKQLSACIHTIKDDSQYKWPLLHNAVSNNNLERTQYLIAIGADVNLKMNVPIGGSNAPLHYSKSPHMAQLLIDAGADVNLQGMNGLTPLHFATIFNQRKTAQLLINAGAKRNIKDNDGKTAREYIEREAIRRIFDEADKADAAMIIQKCFRDKTTRKKISSLQKKE